MIPKQPEPDAIRGGHRVSEQIMLRESSIAGFPIFGPVFMPLTDLVAPNAVIPALKVTSKKQVIQELSAKAAKLTGQSERVIFETLLQREKLGSTGVGNGIAIPHGKLPKLERLFGLFARLDRPVDFEALDGQPVDLIFLLLAPEGAGADHLKALARVARLLRDQDVARKLRESRDAEALFAVLALNPSAAA
jgi:nitrogen PTS system EIIA component